LAIYAFRCIEKMAVKVMKRCDTPIFEGVKKDATICASLIRVLVAKMEDALHQKRIK